MQTNSSHRLRHYIFKYLKDTSMKKAFGVTVFIAAAYGVMILIKNKANVALPPLRRSGLAPDQDVKMSQVKKTVASAMHPSFVQSVRQHTTHPSAVDTSKESKHVTQQELLDCLTTGEWHREPYTKEQEEDVQLYLRLGRDYNKLPVPLQRKDGRCGDVTFPGLKWFRAVCDPYGGTPCCVQGTCQTKTTQDCVCDTCYDLRQRLYAELSRWKNRDTQCQVRQYSTNETCRLLDSGDFLFIGDSHMRHLYMAFQVLLTGDEESGCFGAKLPKELRETHRGLKIFSRIECENWKAREQSSCGERVHIRLSELPSTKYSGSILKSLSPLIGKSGSVLVIGIGHHDAFNSQEVISKVVSPILDMLEKSGQVWPKVIWVGSHALGPLMTPKISSHSNPSVLHFIRAVRDVLKPRGVNYFDTFNLTVNLASQDGSHYSKGAHLLKARVLLEYLSRVGGVKAISGIHTERNKSSLQG